jgi:hypothetical protein
VDECKWLSQVGACLILSRFVAQSLTNNKTTQNFDLYCRLNTFRCTIETCSFCLTEHVADGEYSKYCTSAIPVALAEYIAMNVDAILITKNLGMKKQASFTPDEIKTLNDRMAGIV